MNRPLQEFDACWFHPDMGSEVANGKVVLERWKLHFRSDTFSEEIPMERIVAELGEDGERIYLTDSARPELTLFTLDQSILECRWLAQAEEIRSQLSARQSWRELWRRCRLLVYFAVGCVVVIWGASLALGLAVRSLVAKVPPDWEEEFGRAQIQVLQEHMSLVTDSNKIAQLAGLAAPLVTMAPDGKTPIHFYIVDEETPNAFALPGGHVAVTTGMLRMVDSQDELLGVLAHEMAHVSEKHFERKLISAAGPLVIFGVFLHSRSGAGNLLGVGSGIMVVRGFSQEYETEADDVGWKHLVAANIDPRGMISVFRKLQAYEAQEKLGLGVPQAFNTHPALDKRIARLEKKWKRLSPQHEFLHLTNPVPKPERDDAAPQTHVTR